MVEVEPRVREADAALPIQPRNRQGVTDPWLIVSTLLLAAAGMLMVTSASWSDGLCTRVVNGICVGNQWYYAEKHAQMLVVAFVALWFFSRIDYHWLEWPSLLLLGLSILALIAVLATPLGHEELGARRWLGSGSLSFEPSELVKLTFPLYIAGWLARKGTKIRAFIYGPVQYGVWLGMVIVLIYFQPDMGTVIVITAMSLIVLFVAGIKWWHTFVVLLSGGVGGYLATIVRGYRATRLNTWYTFIFHPSTIQHNSAAQAAAWQIQQALYGIGSGGIFGLGPGASREKFWYLPMAHTDSIFAVIGEEFGLIGTVAVIGLFLWFIMRGLTVARRAPDSYGELLATALTVGIGIQAFLNIGVITGLIPFTGVPLPFISFGGSSLVVTMAWVGVLINIARHRGLDHSSRRRVGVTSEVMLGPISTTAPDGGSLDTLLGPPRQRAGHQRPRLSLLAGMGRTSQDTPARRGQRNLRSSGVTPPPASRRSIFDAPSSLAPPARPPATNRRSLFGRRGATEAPPVGRRRPTGGLSTSEPEKKSRDSRFES